MTATPPDVLRRQIMLTVYAARPELGTDGAGEVADALLSGPLAAQVDPAALLQLAEWVQRERPRGSAIRDRVVLGNIANRIFRALDGATT